MEIHIGASSYLSQNLSGKSKKIYRISSKKEKKFINIDYRNLSPLKKIFYNDNINYVTIFIGKNLKGKNKKQCLYLNYTLPIKILNFLIKLKKKKLRLIFFGSYLENEKNISNFNLNYQINKIKLRKKIFQIYKRNNFEFVWLKLPVVYGLNQNNLNFTSMIINKIKLNEEIFIDYKYNSIHLININDVKSVVSEIKKNWKKFKNKSIIPNSEGPYFIHELLDKINKLLNTRVKIYYKNKKKIKKINLNNKITNFTLKKNFFKFLKQNV